MKNIKEIIVKIDYNWFYSSESGEDYSYCEIEKGNPKVKLISYHEPLGEGDKHYCDVLFDNGTSERIFNVNKIYRKEIK